MPVPRKLEDSMASCNNKGQNNSNLQDEQKKPSDGYIGTIQRKLIHKKQSAMVKVRKVLNSSDKDSASKAADYKDDSKDADGQ